MQISIQTHWNIIGDISVQWNDLRGFFYFIVWQNHIKNVYHRLYILTYTTYQMHKGKMWCTEFINISFQYSTNICNVLTLFSYFLKSFKIPLPSLFDKSTKENLDLEVVLSPAWYSLLDVIILDCLLAFCIQIYYLKFKSIVWIIQQPFTIVWKKVIPSRKKFFLKKYEISFKHSQKVLPVWLRKNTATKDYLEEKSIRFVWFL